MSARGLSVLCAVYERSRRHWGCAQCEIISAQSECLESMNSTPLMARACSELRFICRSSTGHERHAGSHASRVCWILATRRSGEPSSWSGFGFGFR